MFIIIGAWLAAIFFFIKDGVPWLGAVVSGRIRTRGHRREVVERAVDPARFKALAAERFRGLGLGLLAFAIGLCWLIWNVVAAVSSAAGPGGM